MFSKPNQPLGQTHVNEFIETTPIRPPPITYQEYMKNNTDLTKTKMPQLKQITKYYKLPVSGTKPILLERILGYFERCSQSIKIQKIFRGHLLRTCLSLRGEGFKHRRQCVNENDFYSLEPLSEIPVEYFFSFSCGKFIYGCNIISLIHLMKTKSNVKNPYNRENIPLETIKNIINLYDKIKIIFGLPSDAPVINRCSLLQLHGTIQENHRIRQHVAPNNQTVIPVEIIEERRTKLIEIQSKPISVRIQEIFMEMDQLGNYTHSGWFSSLDRREYIRLFTLLFDIWTFRGQLSREVKNYICILNDPFHEIRRQHVSMYNLSFELIQDMCLKVMENMVYCGLDDEYKKIGALHVLICLTGVSMGARTSLPWLYESLHG